jgi:hypothetical protein
MRQRRILFMPLVLLLVIASGCASYRPPDSRSLDEMKKSEASREDLRNQTITLEKEKAAYQKQIADQEAEIAAMNKGLSEQKTEIAEAQKEVAELSKTVDELNTQVKHLQDVRQKETPLQVTELGPPKKEPVKPGKTAKAPQKGEPIAPAAQAKKRTPKSSAEAIAMTKELSDAKRKKPAAPKTASVQPQKGTETAEENVKESKTDAKKETAEVKPLEPSSVDDLAAQMKEFEASGPKTVAPKDAAPAPPKKEQAKPTTKTPATKTKDQQKVARTEPAEAKARDPKAIKIKVLAGNGDIASAKNMAKQLGKMGYRVRATDLAPRSDFAEATIYYGTDHRTTAESMAKKLGGGAATKPLTWSSTFDIIIVTGRER